MANEDSKHDQEAQAERAKRLREQIEKLKSGIPTSSGGSLREEVENRSAEIKRSEEEK